jgi:quercetin dioxygenase-like cupin family protein
VKITTRTESLTGDPMEAANFTGPATGHPVHSSPQPVPVRVGVVHFHAGTRNNWHCHSGGQVLHVVHGEGYVQSRGEPARLIHTGDTVAAEPDEVHWHGAGPDGPMAHLAISMGDITWLESSADEPL